MALKAPSAKRIPEILEMHNDKRVDDYFWMRLSDEQKAAENLDEQTKDVVDYLNAENDYTDTVMAHTKGFQKSLFEEMKGRIKEQDESVPYKYNGYWYITKYEEGKDYPIYTRKKEALDAPEELLFDCNEMAKGHSYFKLSGINISPDNKYVAYGVDTVSRRIYTIRIKNLETGEILPYEIVNTTGGSTWANDNKTLFFTRKDDQTLRSDRIYKYVLGGDPTLADLIYKEEDETFYTFVYKSKSRKYIIIGSASTLTSEYRFLNADTPEAEFQIFQPRIRGIEYSIAHFEDSFYVITNADDASNFKLMKTHETATTKENWKTVLPHRTETLLEDIDIFKNFLVVSERTNGLNMIWIKRWDGTEDYYLPFDNETYTAYTTTNVEFDTEILRFAYNALSTPSSLIDFNMVSKEKTVLKEQEVLGGKFDKNNYASERLWAPAADGAEVPMSIVYRKDTEINENTPLLLYGYGSYGSTIDPYFSTVRLSLLDRGFVYVIAHIRGGEYLGRQWYENGKLLKKKNTFTDFIDCAKHLIKVNYTSANHLYAMGGSAGGLLMGAVINMAPELFKGVIAAVPFVDVVSTMLDETIPLTTGEFDEWGNPKEEEYYTYIKSYSPYDNVEAQSYPNMLVTTGYHDSQVQYWEPAKWVAKLRELKQDTHLLLLRTNMKTGHGGASGRFESLKEVAEEYAFLLDLEGIEQ
ncbi:oligopeptidase B [Neptunitalea chrysea]|uniref:Proline-specific endopeptidase n=1 Tax=Neptunitalea chrysea TaxID=1647581 RepID=A0A9W6B6T1_9FLAO|nr:S9 family peptidase [Neptunitalea chrysea]GLB53673.1 oligopeptidase B [Neptunitalea chrysea]